MYLNPILVRQMAIGGGCAALISAHLEAFSYNKGKTFLRSVITGIALGALAFYAGKGATLGAFALTMPFSYMTHTNPQAEGFGAILITTSAFSIGAVVGGLFEWVFTP